MRVIILSAAAGAVLTLLAARQAAAQALDAGRADSPSRVDQAAREADAGAAATPAALVPEFDAAAEAPSHQSALPPAASAPLAEDVAPGARVRALPVEVEVRAHSRADTLRRSSLAVAVVELRDAKRGASDLGEVLARSEGVAVRRAGGLGSDQRVSLAGLEGEQIRYFLDGLPLELAGYPFGIANVPVNMLERIEIYRGVVPVALGADALGGAVNLVTRAPRAGAHGSASYQGGSFDTHRGTLEGSYLRRGLFVQAAGFADAAENDYPVTVDGVDGNGARYRTQVRRFHDAYRAEGASVALGFVERRWAERLVLRTFLNQYEKELQHDVRMSQPYGAATAGGLSSGGTLSYRHSPFDALQLDGTAGYAYTRIERKDLTSCIYNWFGRCAPSATVRGEIDGTPTDQRVQQHALFARLHARYSISPEQAVRLSLAPTDVWRGGDDRYEARPGSRDPLDAERRLTNLILGVEYTLSALDAALELSAFGKAYLQWVRSEELLRSGEPVRRDRETERAGAGLAMRYELVDAAWVKASYEYATRLPGLDEVFGNAITIEPNLELAPEVSHNGNASLAADYTSARAGRFTGEAALFLRDARDLIFQTGREVYRFENLVSARSLGTMASAGWSARDELLRIAGNVTYQAFRNSSDEGAFANWKGDRIPNRPYLFANASVRGQLRSVFDALDTLSLTYTLRYTHEFFRAWESAGRRETKDFIPDQLVHSLSLTHLAQKSRSRSLSMSLELQNLTDERVYDFFGVQRPGRAVFAKAVAEL